MIDINKSNNLNDENLKLSQDIYNLRNKNNELIREKNILINNNNY